MVCLPIGAPSHGIAHDLRGCANCVFRDSKPGGLVGDYLDLADLLERALVT